MKDHLAISKHDNSSTPVHISILLLGAIFIFATLASRPIDDLDLFTQIRLGERILAERSLWLKEEISFLNSGITLPALGWFAQLLFALLYESLNWIGIVFFCSLLYAATFLAAGATTIGPVRTVSLLSAMALGMTSAMSNCNTRPQAIAALCFGVYYWLLRSNLQGVLRYILFIVVGVVWQNSHPSLSLGLILITLWILFAKEGRRSRSSLFENLALFCIVFSLQWATPDGASVFALGKINLTLSRYFLSISEWMPPYHSSVFSAVIPFWISFALSLLLIATRRFQLSLEEISHFILFTLLSFFAARFILFYSIVMVPIWARWIDAATPKTIFSWIPQAVKPKPFVLLLSISLLWMAILQRVQTPERLPLGGIESLSTILPIGRIYNYREWGGPLTFYGKKGWGLLIDGRIYLYSPETLKSYYSDAAGEREIKDIIGELHPDVFFLHPQFHSELIKKLRLSPLVEEFYHDDESIVFVVKK